MISPDGPLGNGGADAEKLTNEIARAMMPLGGPRFRYPIPLHPLPAGSSLPHFNAAPRTAPDTVLLRRVILLCQNAKKPN